MSKSALRREGIFLPQRAAPRSTRERTSATAREDYTDCPRRPPLRHPAPPKAPPRPARPPRVTAPRPCPRPKTRNPPLGLGCDRHGLHHRVELRVTWGQGGGREGAGSGHVGAPPSVRPSENLIRREMGVGVELLRQNGGAPFASSGPLTSAVHVADRCLPLDHPQLLDRLLDQRLHPRVETRWSSERRPWHGREQWHASCGVSRQRAAGCAWGEERATQNLMVGFNSGGVAVQVNENRNKWCSSQPGECGCCR